MTMSEWIDLCSVKDLQPDSGVCAWAEGRQIALFYMKKDQAVYAVDNYDPIGKANVLSRGMIGDLGGTPMVASPLYKQHYSLETGVCFEDASVRIETYPVRIENDRITVKMRGKS
ncbi:MAG: hypothetical protein Kow0065_23910 [Methylomicrobium sp.]